MPNQSLTSKDLMNSISESIESQISDLSSTRSEQIAIQAIVEQLTNLQTQLTPLGNVNVNNLTASMLNTASNSAPGQQLLNASGILLANIDVLTAMLNTLNYTGATGPIASIQARINGVLNYRPDVAAITG